MPSTACTTPPSPPVHDGRHDSPLVTGAKGDPDTRRSRLTSLRASSGARRLNVVP